MFAFTRKQKEARFKALCDEADRLAQDIKRINDAINFYGDPDPVHVHQWRKDLAARKRRAAAVKTEITRVENQLGMVRSNPAPGIL